jgi:HAD superfamily hydrolase (TIGR01509 family)
VRPRVVVFDLGGVLVRICRTWQHAAESAGVRHALSAELIPLSGFEPFEEYQAGTSERECYLTHLAEFLGVGVAEALDVHNGILVEPYPGALDLVQELHGRGLRTGCLSNTNEPHWHTMTGTDHLPCVRLTMDRMASHEVQLQKPEPEIYALYERTFGYLPQEVVFFDDTPVNVEAARVHGWNAFTVDPHGDPVVEMRGHLRGLGLLEDSEQPSKRFA